MLLTPIPSALDPATGFDNRTQTFTVTGSRFQSGLAVGVRPSAGGSIVPGTVTASTDTSATVDLPLLDAALGSWDLVVVNPDGGTRTLASPLTVVRGPRLISMPARSSATTTTPPGPSPSRAPASRRG